MVSLGGGTTSDAQTLKTIAGESSGNELYLHWNFERFQTLCAESFDGSTGFSFVGSSTQLHVGADDFAGNGIRLTIYNCLRHKLAFEKNGFHFGGENFLPSHINQLRVSAEKPHVISVNLDPVAGDKVPVVGEGTGSIQVAEHRGVSLNLQDSVHHSQVVPFSSNFDPKRVTGLGFRPQYSQFDQSVGLTKFNIRENRPKSN